MSSAARHVLSPGDLVTSVDCDGCIVDSVGAGAAVSRAANGEVVGAAADVELGCGELCRLKNRVSAALVVSVWW
jgi:hypothetical protein